MKKIMIKYGLSLLLYVVLFGDKISPVILQ